MSKLIWLVNPATFREVDIHFPAYLAKNGNHKIQIMLLSDGQSAVVPVLSNDPVFPTTNYTIPEMDVDDRGLRMENEGRERVRAAVERAGLQFAFHTSPAEDENGIVEESLFADLVLISAGLSFHEFSEEIPSRFVMDILPKLQCPVLIMPDDHQEVTELYLTYNGGYSSMYAIRQMIYLFPEFKRLPVTVIYVEEGKGGIPFERSLKEFLYGHFDNLTIRLLRGEPASAIMDELLLKRNVMATFGAFGRNKISRFFRSSNAEGVLQVINVPVFITHP